MKHLKVRLDINDDDSEVKGTELLFHSEQFVPKVGEEIRLNNNPKSYTVKKFIHHFCENERDLTLVLE